MLSVIPSSRARTEAAPLKQDFRVSYAPSLPWTLESLDLSGIDRSRVRHNEELFFLLCSSSFVESGSDLYTHNLVAHFNGDEELQTWLSQHWEHEELQHGRRSEERRVGKEC